LFLSKKSYFCEEQSTITMKNKTIITMGVVLISGLVFLNSCRKEAPVLKNAGSELNTGEESLAATVMTAAGQGKQYVPNQVLVKFKKGTTPEMKGLVHARVAAKLEEHIHTRTMKESGDMEGVQLLNVPMAALEAIQNLKRMPEVEYAEPNYIYTHYATSNDPYYTNGSLWGMYSSSSSPSNNYGCAAATAWDNGNTGSSDVYVAIIDEGVMNTHNDLAANCWVNPNDPVDGVDNDGNGYKDDKWGWDFVNRDNSTYDNVNDDHATHVAGTIGAVGGNNNGVVGVNWSVKMISCKFLGSSGGTTANAIKAVDYVTDLKTRAGLNIVATNNSWGGGGYSQALKDAIDRAGAQDILFIAAAGNSGTNNDASPSYPASYSSANIIAVAAIASNGTLASFSQYGASSVDIGAPGVSIYSTVPSNNKKNPSAYAAYNGTSMATPHVTGAAAIYAATHSGSTAADIKSAILNSAVSTSSLSGKCVTGGRLNVSGF
jgi:subtilisin family serine protease